MHKPGKRGAGVTIELSQGNKILSGYHVLAKSIRRWLKSKQVSEGTKTKTWSTI